MHSNWKAIIETKFNGETNMKENFFCSIGRLSGDSQWKGVVLNKFLRNSKDEFDDLKN